MCSSAKNEQMSLEYPRLHQYSTVAESISRGRLDILAFLASFVIGSCRGRVAADIDR